MQATGLPRIEGFRRNFKSLGARLKETLML
jgi:hypothetical protein